MHFIYFYYNLIELNAFERDPTRASSCTCINQLAHLCVGYIVDEKQFMKHYNYFKTSKLLCLEISSVMKNKNCKSE